MPAASPADSVECRGDLLVSKAQGSRGPMCKAANSGSFTGKRSGRITCTGQARRCKPVGERGGGKLRRELEQQRPAHDESMTWRVSVPNCLAWS